MNGSCTIRIYIEEKIKTPEMQNILSEEGKQVFYVDRGCKLLHMLIHKTTSN